MPTLSRSTANLIAGLLALALTAGLVIRTSSAVFTAQTDNNGNSLEAGTIVLNDDDGGATALLTMSNIAPGEFSQNCIRVEYDGTLDPERVKVFSTSVFSASVANMEDQVNITIEQGAAGSPGSFDNCTGFDPGVKLVDAVPLSTWHGDATSYTTGDGTWNPTGPNQARIYRITLELDLSTGNAYQGASLSGINLTWETQSTPTGGLVP